MSEAHVSALPELLKRRLSLSQVVQLEEAETFSTSKAIPNCDCRSWGHCLVCIWVFDSSSGCQSICFTRVPANSPAQTQLPCTDFRCIIQIFIFKVQPSYTNHVHPSYTNQTRKIPQVQCKPWDSSWYDQNFTINSQCCCECHPRTIAYLLQAEQYCVSGPPDNGVILSRKGRICIALTRMYTYILLCSVLSKIRYQYIIESVCIAVCRVRPLPQRNNGFKQLILRGANMLLCTLLYWW